MASVEITSIIALGLDTPHEGTVYQAYEDMDEDGNMIGPLFDSGDDYENLLGRQFPLIREDGTYYPPELPFIIRIALIANGVQSEWKYLHECYNK